MCKNLVFYCLLGGDAGSGKESFFRHHVPKDDNRFYPGGDEGVMMLPLVFHSTNGTIQFNLWDADSVHGKCLAPTNCAIIFDRISTRVKVATRPNWNKDLAIVFESIGLTAVFSTDVGHSGGELNQNWLARSCKKKMSLEYNNLWNPESPFQIEKIFLWLSRRLLNTPDVAFISYPMFMPRFFAKKRTLSRICNFTHGFYLTVSKYCTSDSETSDSADRSDSKKGGGDFRKGGPKVVPSNDESKGNGDSKMDYEKVCDETK